jgi:hypothetical protein
MYSSEVLYPWRLKELLGNCMRGGYIHIMALLFAALVLAALAPHVSAQSTNDSGGLPLYFIIDSALDAHEQDIRDGIFEYRLQAVKDSPEMQAALIKGRYDELRLDVEMKKYLLGTLFKGGTMSADRLKAVAREMNASIEKLDGRSRSLEARMAGLGVNDKKDYKDLTPPIMGEPAGAQGMPTPVYQKDKPGNGNSRRPL